MPVTGCPLGKSAIQRSVVPEALFVLCDSASVGLPSRLGHRPKAVSRELEMKTEGLKK